MLVNESCSIIASSIIAHSFHYKQEHTITTIITMPIHIVPVAIVTAKVCASAVVSLSPVAMRGDEDEEGGPAAPQTSVRDLFRADFYKREFERLSSEAESITTPPTTQRRPVPNRRGLLQSMRGLSMSSLASERSVPYVTTASSRRIMMQTAAATAPSSSQSVASKDSDDSSQFSFCTIHVPEDEPWLASRESLRRSRQESLRSALHA